MKNLIAVVLGYLVMAVLVMVFLTVLYQLLGADRAFVEGSYAVSGTWSVLSLVLSLFAALIGGLVCARLSQSRSAVIALAAFAFAMGVIFSIPSFLGGDPAVAARVGDIGNMQAFQNAVTPGWVAVLTAVVGAVGVLVGGRLPPQPDDTLPL